MHRRRATESQLFKEESGIEVTSLTPQANSGNRSIFSRLKDRFGKKMKSATKIAF